MSERENQTIYANDPLVDEFLKNRNIIISGTIDAELAKHVMILLLKLEKEDSEAPINLYIDSGGGVVPSGLAIIDTMNKIKCPVNTFCYSMAASMAAVILACGAKRYAFKHSKIMIHQPLLNFEGRYRQSDLSVEARELEETRFDLETILTDSTKGKTSFEEMHKACEKDNYLKPEVALKMGLIDEIV